MDTAGKAYKAYIIHDGILLGQEFHGFAFSESTKEDLRRMLPGTYAVKNLEQPMRPGRLGDVIGQVRLIDNQLVLYLFEPLGADAAAMLRPALALIVDGRDDNIEVQAVCALALVPKEEGDLGYLEPYPKAAV